LQVVVADNRWNISQDTVAFTISTETFSRAAEGPAYTNNISFDVLDRSEAQTLMDAIGRDLTLNVTTTKGKSLGDFSLKGSQAAMRAFAPSWDGIHQASAAATSSDPFIDTSTYSRSYDHTIKRSKMAHGKHGLSKTGLIMTMVTGALIFVAKGRSANFSVTWESLANPRLAGNGPAPILTHRLFPMRRCRH